MLLFVALSCMVLGYLDAQETKSSVYQGCNHTILEGQGVILSPNFPSPYDPNSRCQWQITVERHRTIFLTFRHFNIESNPTCSYDRLSIYNGPTDSHPLLGKFCGPFRPSDITTTSNRMLLRFESDDATQKKGFVALFFSTLPEVAKPNSCGGLLLNDEGSFHSVNFPKSPYPNGMTCTWHIRTSPGRSISLHFSKLNIEESANCQYDAATIMEGWSNSEKTKILGRFCKMANVPQTIQSEGNEMYVIFSADSSGNDDGFLAQYVTNKEDRLTIAEAPPVVKKKQPAKVSPDVPEQCQETQLLTSSGGTIVSPGFKATSEYAPNLRCSWRIVTPDSTRVTLRFTSFELEEDPECLFDYVMVFSGRTRHGRRLARYCGSLDDQIVTSHNNEMFIEFVSDSGRGAAGFRAEFTSQSLTLPAVTTTAAVTTKTSTTRRTTTTTTPSAPITFSSTTVLTSIATDRPSAICPDACPPTDLAQTVCSTSHVLLFKIVRIKSSKKAEGKRLYISILRIFKHGPFTAGKRKGSKFWIDVPCISCLPALRKRAKYILAGGESGRAEIGPSDLVEVFKRKLLRYIKKAVRRCRRSKKKRKRNSGKRRGKKRRN